MSLIWNNVIWKDRALCMDPEPFSPVICQLLAKFPGVQRFTLGITEVADDAEEIGLQRFLLGISVGIDLFDVKLSRTVTILEDLENGGVYVLLAVFAKLEGGWSLEKRGAG